MTPGSYTDRRAGIWRTARVLSLAYTLVVLTAAVACHRIGGYGVETDFYGQYAPQARSIQQLLLTGQGRVEIDPLHGPVYPFVVAVLGLVCGDLFRAAVLAAVLAAGSVLYATHRLGSIGLDDRAALLLLLLIASNETFIRHSYEAGTEMPFLRFSILAVVFALRPPGTGPAPTDKRRPAGPLVLAGVFAGLTFLTRQNGIALVFGIFVVLLGLNPFAGRARERIREAVWYSAGAHLVSAPWFVYCYQATGHFFVSESHVIVASGLLFRGDSWDRFANLHASRFGSLSQVLAYNPALLLRNLALNVPDHLGRDLISLMGPVVGVCAAAGMAVLAGTRRLSRVQVAILALGLAQFAVLLLLFHRQRFSLPLIPYYALATVYFIEWLGSRRARMARYLAVAAVSLTGILGVWSNWRTSRSGPVEVFAIRERFQQVAATAENAEWGAALCARKPHLSYYLEMKAVSFPYVDRYEELLAGCRRRGADYLFYGPAEAKTRPQFRDLLDANRTHPGLEPVVTLNDPPAVLYRLTLQASE